MEHSGNQAWNAIDLYPTSEMSLDVKENKVNDKASVKVNTRRVGQEVFWDTKLERHRTFKELEMDPEICPELMEYKSCQAKLEELGIFSNLKEANFRIKAESCWDSMELEHPATLEELGMDPQNEGIISDFFGYVRAKKLCNRIGPTLVYDSPRTDRSSIIAAMANYLTFDVYHLDLRSFSSFAEMDYTLASTTNCSVIAIEGLYHCAEMLLNLETDESAAQHLLHKIDALFLRPDNERIFVFTTNQGDRHDAASLRPVKMDVYIHMSLPQPIALPDGGKRTYHNSRLLSNSEMPNFDATKNKAVKVYSRRRRRVCSHSMELEQPPTFAELGKDPENEGIISDLLRFVRDKELYKRIGKDWKRGYLLYDSPGTDRSFLTVAMANCLGFDIHDLDLMGLSFMSKLNEAMHSIRNRSLIAIKNFDHWFGKHPDSDIEVLSRINKNELTLSGLFEIINELLSHCGDQQIIVLTTNNSGDRSSYFVANWATMKGYCLEGERPVEVTCLSSPQSSAVPGGGEIVGFIPLSSGGFAATNNRANLVGQNPSGSTASHSNTKRPRDTEVGKRIKLDITEQDLRQLFGCSREVAAKKLGVGEAKLKQICREYGIMSWPTQIGGNDERNTSSTCKASTHGQTEMVGHRSKQIVSISSLFVESVASGGISEGAFQQKDQITMSFAYPSFAYPIHNDLVCAQPHVASKEMVSENTGNSDLASRVEARMEEFVFDYGFPWDQTPSEPMHTFPTFMPDDFGWEGYDFDPALSQRMPTFPTIPDTGATIPTIATIMPPVIAAQDTGHGIIKAIHRNHTIRFKLPLTSGLIELKEKVAVRLKLQLDSFDVKYQDEEGDLVLISCDEDLRDYLQTFSSLDNPLIKLRILDTVVMPMKAGIILTEKKAGIILTEKAIRRIR